MDPQDDLFGDTPAPSQPLQRPRLPSAPPARATGPVQPTAFAADQRALGELLSPLVHLGTSSWSYPGWTDLVWARAHSESTLSRQGLRAYAQHPLLRTVSIDRSFYQALPEAQYATYAAQVPASFRSMVKAPASVADALIRDERGRGRSHNPLFLDPDLALSSFVMPALQGLGTKLGALVFQLSPMPQDWLRQPERLFARLHALLSALPRPRHLHQAAPDAVIAVELRDASLVRPELAEVLRDTGAAYCLGLHARMPDIDGQLPVLRKLWPSPVVCRWNLHRRHGAHGYESAKALYEPFNRLQDEDLATRETLAKVVRAAAQAQLPAYVSISNKAEGCAPLSVEALARAIVDPPASNSHDT